MKNCNVFQRDTYYLVVELGGFIDTEQSGACSALNGIQIPFSWVWGFGILVI